MVKQDRIWGIDVGPAQTDLSVVQTSHKHNVKLILHYSVDTADL